MERVNKNKILLPNICIMLYVYVNWNVSKYLVNIVYCVIGLCAIYLLNLRSYLKKEQFNIYTLDYSSSYTTFAIFYSPVHKVNRFTATVLLFHTKKETPLYLCLFYSILTVWTQRNEYYKQSG